MFEIEDADVQQYVTESIVLPAFVNDAGYGVYAKDVQVIVGAALGAGQILMGLYNESQRNGISIGFKADKSPVTKADLWAQSYAEDAIRRNYPDACIDGEEGINGNENAHRLFRMDPLDGTQNFSLGMGGDFSFVLGEYIDKKLVCAVVYEPMLRMLYVAVREYGASKFMWRDDGTWQQYKLSVEDLDVGDEQNQPFVVMDTKAYDEDPVLIKAINYLGYYTGEPLPGSALKVAKVADNKNVCGMFRSQRGNPDVHDVAVASLLVTEAGGLATSLSGGDLLDENLNFYDGYIIAAPKAHADIRQIHRLFHEHLARLGIAEDDLSRKQVNDLAQSIASEVHATRAK